MITIGSSFALDEIFIGFSEPLSIWDFVTKKLSKTVKFLLISDDHVLAGLPQELKNLIPGLCIFQDCLSSGVARVYCALKQEISLRPPSTKTIKFETKNKCESCGRSKSRAFTAVI